MDNSISHTYNHDEIRARLSADIPLDKKWEVLKPVIWELWIDENQKLSELVQNIKALYEFDASETQYKYRFKKWKWNKSISTPKKEAIIKYRQSRAAAGESTELKYKGKKVDQKKLQRFLKQNDSHNAALDSLVDTSRDLKLLTGSEFLLGNSIFLNWNMPYGLTRSFMGQGSIVPATSPMSLSTPSGISVATPPINNALSPTNAPSPLTTIKHKKETIDRAYMLIRGRYRDLINSMNNEQKENVSLWLYQFWLYGFKTAKYWGRGPRTWDADRLRFHKFLIESPAELPNTPEQNPRNKQHHPASPDLLMVENLENPNEPSPLCRWSIHYDGDVDYDSVRSRTPSPEPYSDMLNEEAWKPWPSSLAQQSCQRVLTRGLASNNFSNVDSANLPIAIPQMIKASEGSKMEFLEETLGFSIMARNYDMINGLMDKFDEPRDVREEAQKIIARLDPIHLAATFLDGHKSCCLVIDSILFPGLGDFRASDKDNLGHTVFDKLMISVLKAHTSIKPGDVDNELRNETRFAGEETDICGRWDADSGCFRKLLAKGNSCIPSTWKHKFCHTSVQAICHCIEILKLRLYSIGDLSMLEVRSGLFVNRCELCGLRMDLGVLHLVVLTAFSLAQFGTKDEDLFGILAVLLCVLKEGADPLSRVDISASSLFYEEQKPAPMECDHEELSPSELADCVPRSLTANWSREVRVGWDLFCHVLRHSEQAAVHQFSNDYRPGVCDEDCYYRTDDTLEYNPKLVPIFKLYAAVQTEYLTYRRLEEGDPWLSPNFDMLEVLRSLQIGNEISVGLLRNAMMNPTCACGSFHQPFPAAKHVMSHHFSNLEIWSRTTFIPSLKDMWG